MNSLFSSNTPHFHIKVYPQYKHHHIMEDAGICCTQKSYFAYSLEITCIDNSFLSPTYICVQAPKPSRISNTIKINLS